MTCYWPTKLNFLSGPLDIKLTNYWSVYELNVTCYLKWVWHLSCAAQVASSIQGTIIYHPRKEIRLLIASSVLQWRKCSLIYFITHPSQPSYSARSLRKMGLTTELYWMLSQSKKRKIVRERKREGERGGMIGGMHNTSPFLPLSFSTALLWALFWHKCQHVLSFKQLGNGQRSFHYPWTSFTLNEAAA